MDLFHWVVPRPPPQGDLGRAPPTNLLYPPTLMALPHLCSSDASHSGECAHTRLGGTGHTTPLFLPPSSGLWRPAFHICSLPLLSHGFATGNLRVTHARPPAEDHHVALGLFSVYPALPPQRHLHMLYRQLRIILIGRHTTATLRSHRHGASRPLRFLALRSNIIHGELRRPAGSLQDGTVWHSAGAV